MMQFDHEKLDVYRVSIEFAAWVEPLMNATEGHRHLKDQLTRAAMSITLNIAERCGKRPGLDRNRFYETARASSLECAACLDVGVAKAVWTCERVVEGKNLLGRLVSMLTRMAPPNGT